MQRLDAGPVICAEGYVFELERRGYLQAGAFVPEVVLEHPEVVTQLHRDFVHAGSDVVEALTYYAHREKLRVIGREQDLEPINRRALGAREGGGDGTGALFAGDICNTNIYDPRTRPRTRRCARCSRSRSAGPSTPASTFVVGETFSWAQEALIALDVDQAGGQTAVITLAMHKADVTREDWTRRRRCKRLARCRRRCRRSQLHSRPATMMPLLREIRRASRRRWPRCRLPYRTSEQEPSFQSLCDTHWHFDEGTAPVPGRARSVHLQPLRDRRVRPDAWPLDIRYLGVCCGAGPTTSARWPSRSASTAGEQYSPTCRSTRSSARTSGSGRCRRNTADKL
jgi:betaine-homocysteine S-methyltransferase